MDQEKKTSPESAEIRKIRLMFNTAAQDRVDQPAQHSRYQDYLDFEIETKSRAAPDKKTMSASDVCAILRAQTRQGYKEAILQLRRASQYGELDNDDICRGVRAYLQDECGQSDLAGQIDLLQKIWRYRLEDGRNEDYAASVNLIFRRVFALGSVEVMTEALQRLRNYFPDAYHDHEEQRMTAYGEKADVFLKAMERMDEDKLLEGIQHFFHYFSQPDVCGKLWAAGVQQGVARKNDALLISLIDLPVDSERDYYKAGLDAQAACAIADACLARCAYDSEHDMSGPGVALVRYRSFVEKAYEFLAPEAARLDARYLAMTRGIFDGTMARLRAAAEQPERVREWTWLPRLMQRTTPDRKDLLRALCDLSDAVATHATPADTLYFATDATIAMKSGFPDALSAARAAVLTDALIAAGDENDMRHLRAHIAQNRPDLAALGARLDEVLPPQDATDIVARLSPVIDCRNDEAGREFLKYVRALPHEDAARAQADELADVFAALERAERDLQAHQGRSRSGVPMTAAGLRALMLDLCDKINVVQMQAAIIAPATGKLADYLKGLMKQEGWSGPAIDCSQFGAGGGRLTVLTSPDGKTAYNTGFDFLQVRVTKPYSTGKTAYAEKKMIAIPIVTVDETIMQQTIEAGDDKILPALRDISAVFNHDYYHHFTGRLINAYFTPHYYPVSQTPYGVAMGPERKIKGLSLTKYGDRQDFREYESHGPEQLYRHYMETYVYNGTDAPRFAEGNPNYEYHSLTLHNQLYRGYMDAGPAGAKMRAYVDNYFDGVAQLRQRMTETGKSPEDINRNQMYYSNLLAFHLRRLVPHEHPLMQQAEARINTLGIDPDYARAVFDRRVDIVKRANGNTLKRYHAVNAQIGVEAHRADLSIGEMVRWQGCATAVRVLNLMYGEKYEAARAQALPVMRDMLSVVARDMQIVEYRGGRAAFVAQKERAIQEKQKAAQPALITELVEKTQRHQAYMPQTQPA